MRIGKLLTIKDFSKLKMQEKIYIISKNKYFKLYDGVAIVNKIDYINGIMHIKPNNAKVIILFSISEPILYNSYDIYEYIEEPKYTGIEILQMIKDEQLKVGDELIGYMPDGRQDGIMKIMEGENGCLYIKNVNNPDKEELDSWDLINMIFSVKEKEYLTFDEARKSGRRFKHMSWNEYLTLKEVLIKLSEIKIKDDLLNEAMGSRVWEVEN